MLPRVLGPKTLVGSRTSCEPRSLLRDRRPSPWSGAVSCTLRGAGKRHHPRLSRPLLVLAANRWTNVRLCGRRGDRNCAVSRGVSLRPGRSRPFVRVRATLPPIAREEPKPGTACRRERFADAPDRVLPSATGAALDAKRLTQPGT